MISIFAVLGGHHVKESQIIYERDPYFVMLENGKYYVMRNTSTHSVSEEICYEDRSIAKARVDYLAGRAVQ